MAESTTLDLADDQMHKGTGAAQTIVSSGTYTDSAGAQHCVYAYSPTWWRDFPWIAPAVHTHVYNNTSVQEQEKPHETVQRAVREIARAARELARSAEQMGVPVDEEALEEAIIGKLRAAL